MTTTTPRRTLWNALFLAGVLACYFVAGGVEADDWYAYSTPIGARSSAP